MSTFLTRCAHPLCNTTVTDWNAVQCDHRVVVCEACSLEEACEECRWDVLPSINEARALQGLPPLTETPEPRPLPDVDDSHFDHDEMGRPTSNAAPGWRGRMRNR